MPSSGPPGSPPCASRSSGNAWSRCTPASTWCPSPRSSPRSSPVSGLGNLLGGAPRRPLRPAGLAAGVRRRQRRHRRLRLGERLPALRRLPRRRRGPRRRAGQVRLQRRAPPRADGADGAVARRSWPRASWSAPTTPGRSSAGSTPSTPSGAAVGRLRQRLVPARRARLHRHGAPRRHDQPARGRSRCSSLWRAETAAPATRRASAADTANAAAGCGRGSSSTASPARWRSASSSCSSASSTPSCGRTRTRSRTSSSSTCRCSGSASAVGARWVVPPRPTRRGPSSASSSLSGCRPWPPSSCSSGRPGARRRAGAALVLLLRRLQHRLRRRSTRPGSGRSSPFAYVVGPALHDGAARVPHGRLVPVRPGARERAARHARPPDRPPPHRQHHRQRRRHAARRPRRPPPPRDRRHRPCCSPRSSSCPGVAAALRCRRPSGAVPEAVGAVALLGLAVVAMPSNQGLWAFLNGVDQSDAPPRRGAVVRRHHPPGRRPARCCSSTPRRRTPTPTTTSTC